MARNRYIRTNSNYVLKGMHQSTNVGNIYERNWMTLDGLNSYAPGGSFYSGSEGFKMLPSNEFDSKKRHHFGFWLKNEGSEYWTGNNMADDGEEPYTPPPSQSLSKPNYSSLLDFAHYGSAIKLVESSLRKIINEFPGEVFLRSDYAMIDGVRRYKVDNPFNIDFSKFYINEDDNINVLRIFGKSYNDYRFYSESGLAAIVTWTRISTNANVCNPHGSLLATIDLGTISGSDKHLLLFEYNINGERTLFHDGSFTNGYIRPTNACINKFFKSLDDFQAKLLDRKTDYTTTINTPEENEKGYFEVTRQYTWPKRPYGEWNLDISSETYKTYVTDLLNIADFYDRYFSDNLWARMTHESIINMDETTIKFNNGELYDEMSYINNDIVKFDNGKLYNDTPVSKQPTDGEAIDNTIVKFNNGQTSFMYGHKVKKFLHIAGRMFDDIKRFGDGISYSNAVTYDEARNKSDDFLSEDLEICGWDIKLPVFSVNDKFITSPLYPGHVEGYNARSANNEFYRRLLLNTNAILAAKGTKRSIEMVLSLFGYRSLNFVEHSFHEVERKGKSMLLTWDNLTDDEKNNILRNVYDINEYVYVATDDSLGFSQKTVEKVKNINGLKLTYDDLNEDEYQGIPVKEVIFTKEEMITGLTTNWEVKNIGTEIVEKNYLIPWYDKNKLYDGELYFESKGGWGFSASKTNYIEGYGEKYCETGEGLKVYDESVKNLKFKETINDLLNAVNESYVTNDVYYVYDISGAKDYDWGLLGNEVEPTLSHYFILKDEMYSRKLGVLRDSNKNVIIEEGTGYVNPEQFEDSEFTGPESLEGYPNINWDELPIKKYGWKNISEEELQANITKDSQRVFYLEGIIDNNIGNNPHSGKGHYDDGETYKNAFEDVFRAAREDYEYDEVDEGEEGYEFTENLKVFNLKKEIDNVKCWYFTDLTEHSKLQRLQPIGGGEFTELGVETSMVGDTENFVRHYPNKEEVDIYNTNDNLTEIDKVFSTKHYPMMMPVNPEGGSTDDEAAANSIVNTKSLYIEFLPDYKTAKSMYEFIEDVVMHYAKQVIPSTTLLKYKIPMTGLESFCYKRTYTQSALL